jgi:hypothetical protein
LFTRIQNLKYEKLKPKSHEKNSILYDIHSKGKGSNDKNDSKLTEWEAKIKEVESQK